MCLCLNSQVDVCWLGASAHVVFSADTTPNCIHTQVKYISQLQCRQACICPGSFLKSSRHINHYKLEQIQRESWSILHWLLTESRNSSLHSGLDGGSIFMWWPHTQQPFLFHVVTTHCTALLIPCGDHTLNSLSYSMWWPHILQSSLIPCGDHTLYSLAYSMWWPHTVQPCLFHVVTTHSTAFLIPCGDHTYYSPRLFHVVTTHSIALLIPCGDHTLYSLAYSMWWPHTLQPFLFHVVTTHITVLAYSMWWPHTL